MLTKDLLEVKKRKPNITPQYRSIDEYRPTAEQVIEAYRPGRTRGRIEDEVEELETHDTFKLVRGLSKLLDRRSTFEQQAAKPPETLRAAVFEQGFVTDTDERQEAVAEVADTYDLMPDKVENGLWADREDEQVLVSTPDIEPDTLLRQYNLSLTQTLLFDALELDFTASSNYQEIFGLMKYLGLMYKVDEDLTVNVTGPAALFKKTRKYGTTLAKLLPSIMKADEWTVSAQVETEVSDETRIYEFSLDHTQENLFPEQTTVESFDSEVERSFAKRIDSLAEGWKVKREPTILRAGNRVMIPDFSFKRQTHNRENRDNGNGSGNGSSDGGSDSGDEFFLEVVGFWTPEYLSEKLEKVRRVESEQPVMLAVNESLNCTKEDFEDANVDRVFFYGDSIPVKPVLSRLNTIEDRRVEQDLQTLGEDGLEVEVSTEDVTAIDELAERYQVEPGAIREYLADRDRFSGMMSNDRYVPESVLNTIREEVDEMESPTLADVAPILERYGVGQSILDEIGYTVEYTSLNQEEAAVRRKDN